MTDFQSLGAFAPDTLLLAFVVAGSVELLKRTLLKKYSDKPVVVLLPFALGVLLYAAYYVLCRLPVQAVAEGVGYVLKNGVAVGCVSTLFAALGDKLFGKTKLSGKALIARELLEFFAAPADLDGLAAEVVAVISEAYSDEDVQRVRHVLAGYRKREGEPVRPYAESDLVALAELIVRTLKETA